MRTARRETVREFRALILGPVRGRRPLLVVGILFSLRGREDPQQTGGRGAPRSGSPGNNRRGRAEIKQGSE